jgi:hypothetical protein
VSCHPSRWDGRTHTKRSLGTRKYATTSSAWQGVVSAMTNKQVAALSTEIVQDLKKK